MYTKFSVDYQSKIQKGNPVLELAKPCRIGDGIISLSKSDQHSLENTAIKCNKSMRFFIPASGSGSRMFEFLFQYLEQPTEQNIQQTEHFFSALETLAIFQHFSKEMKENIRQGKYKMKDVLDVMLTDLGMDLAAKPKALIPFHLRDPFVLNALQEQIIQAQKIHPSLTHLHFTIQKEHEVEMRKSIDSIRNLVSLDVEIDFSYQKKETNSVALDSEFNPAIAENGDVIERPSGHGALLKNLNEQVADYVLVKNIDNVQHWDKHAISEKWWRILVGILETIRPQMAVITETKNWTSFETINTVFQMVETDEWRKWNEEQMISFLNRPIRVCGMVRNEGQPGGGPYWVKENNKITKQIVEKAQINSSEDQRNVMLKSTHFNPVMMALCPNNLLGEKLDLDKFVDHEKYFVVEKTQSGKAIQYLELPGLWNGSMAEWITIFVEVPNQTFSPVKSILDLLDPLHKSKEKI